MDISRLQGSIVAIITPMTDDGAIDEAALRRLVDWHVEQGTHGIVAVGTTGESPTLDHDEHRRVVEIVIEQAAGRVPVIAGTGSNSTAEAIDLTKHAAEAGADAALVVVPYYNKPTQAGLYAHFRAVAEAAPELPVLIYNVPGRTVADISNDTITKLAKDVPNIVGIKDATGDLNRPSLLRLSAGADFVQLSGEDGTALGFNAHGGRGCISVTANVAPKLCAEFQEATLRGDFAKALELQDRLMPLHKALFVETSPGPVKYAVSLLGFCSPFARLPMVEIADSSKEAVKAAMRHAGILD